MKYYRTANLEILQTWFLGGSNDANGNYSEGFHCLDPTNIDFEDESLFDNYKINLESLEKMMLELLLNAIEEDDKFMYWDNYYKFKKPSDKNWKILVKRVAKDIQETMDELRNGDLCKN